MTSPAPTQRRDPSIYASGIVAAIWVILAWVNPDNTYHAAPPLVAGIFPVMHRIRLGRLEPKGAAAAGIGGYANLLLVTGVLWITVRLDGPALFGLDSPAIEALILGAAGSVAGALVAMAPSLLRRP